MNIRFAAVTPPTVIKFGGKKGTPANGGSGNPPITTTSTGTLQGGVKTPHPVTRPKN